DGEFSMTIRMAQDRPDLTGQTLLTNDDINFAMLAPILSEGEGYIMVRAKHWGVPGLAEEWGMSRSTVYRWFVGEEGIIIIPPPTNRVSRKKQRIDFYIPEPVAERVYRK